MGKRVLTTSEADFLRTVSSVDPNPYTESADNEDEANLLAFCAYEGWLERVGPRGYRVSGDGKAAMVEARHQMMAEGAV